MLLDRTLDFDETLRSLARLAVPDLADWCTVDVIDEGELRNVVVSHVDPSKVEFGSAMLSSTTIRPTRRTARPR